MSLHKITAGAGYDYLTRQVAAMDSSEKGHTGLASYYEQKGESPGVWVGSGLVGLDGLSAGDPVTAEQMRLLFGSGMHPLADQRLTALATDASDADRRTASRLGNPFLVIEHDVPEFQIAVAKAYAAYNEAKGVPGDWPVPKEVRWQIRTDLAKGSFTQLHGRPPADSRELHGHLATLSRPLTTAVAGFDLTFSPVKSVSALWALADPATAAAIERAHNTAIAEALRFIERRALFTRTGAQGVRQVDVTGLVGTAFTHRDSRAGDPDLHTHVAVANKVQTVTDGRWLAIDGRLLFKAKVTASEVYNTALERHLAASLGVRFAERPQPDARKRAVRELVGIDPALNARWSARRAAIEDRQGELAARFQEAQERPPTVIEARTLAQQATLETRPAKHSPRSLAEQRQAWRSEADAVLRAGGVQRMIAATLHPGRRPSVRTNGRWVRREAARIVATVEASRSTWQDWHIRAEALRVVRAAEVPAHRVEEVAGRLVHAALARHSIRLAPPPDGIAEPAQLRRLDGQSVYSVAGATWHTSARILAAEQRLVDAAGRIGGHVIADAAVDVALLEAEANRTPLNAGQAALVRAMGTSGRLVQLAIAPAGAGKTTAMRTLAHAWQSDGGTVIGLAPSASAAAQLGEQIGHQADTLALLTHALATGRPLPEWAQRIDPSTLVIIDEAGMADTLTLDRVVEFVLDRGGSVRLIGDTQQLAAIGAGGVLRDIDTTHGALRLNELVRFADPAEAAASLALRDGDPSALGFYLDQRRVHVGDQAACVDNLFHAWATDRAAGLDALMLAPTRDLVADLNQRAQAHLHGHRPGPTALLADGNTAGVGDVIITRTNNRRLATTASDWVKNGDRWHITALNTNGSMTVVHQHTSARVVLPAAYVAASIDLGYACTIHAAQGVTADTMHGLLTADETRQQLYTMLTRGRLANHAYLQVVGSGDPHSLIRPEAVLPPTATDLLEAILGRDEQPLSASSTARQLADPAGRLADATHRYADAIGFATESTTPPATLTALDSTAEQLVPGLTDSPAWPTLRSHLILDAAAGTDPVRALTDAVGEGSLADAADPAAVLVWRLPPVGRRDSVPGPLPWLPGVPDGLVQHADWGDYLRRRHELVMELTQEVRADAIAADGRPGWLPSSITSPDPATIGDVAVWRAAHGVPDHDTRPTGERQHAPLERRHQHRLDQRVVDHLAPAAAEWTPTITRLAPATGGDPFVPVLAHRLAQVASARLDAAGLLRAAISEGPLPDDHPAAALWWRISRHINPAVATRLHADHAELLTNWLPEMGRLVGPERARSLQYSAWWPPLVASVEDALHRGWHLDQIINANPPEDGIDEAQALVWRTNLLLAPIPYDEPEPEPRWETIDLPDSAPIDLVEPDEPFHPEPEAWEPDPCPTDAQGVQADEPTDLAFTLEAQLRRVMQPPGPSEADVLAQLDRAYAWLDSPHTPERLAHVNELAAQFYEQCYRGSWAQPYLAGRFHADLTGHPDIRPGYAPNTWTALINHLHHHGITDAELVAVGLAKEASTGRLIDRFRDRVVFPIAHEGQVLGFVGRRNPNRSEDEKAGPKYLNTPDTLLFHKRAQLYVVGHDQLDAGAIPVIVEGPMDAIAITTATGGRYAGVAPLGTSLSTEQAVQLRGYEVPIIATDNDPAGRAAAERDFWTLTHQLIQPRAARLPDGTDPADLVAAGEAARLTTAVDEAPSQAQVLIDDYFDRLPTSDAAARSLAVIATRSPEHWEPDLDALAERIWPPTDVLRPALYDHIRASLGDLDPVKSAPARLSDTSLERVQRGVEAAPPRTPQRVPFSPNQRI